LIGWVMQSQFIC